MDPDTSDTILLDFVRGTPVSALAELNAIPLFTLVSWLKSPPIRQLITDLRELADTQTAIAAQQARAAAIRTLESSLIDEDISPAQRASASLLIRFTPRTPPRAPSRAAESPPALDPSATLQSHNHRHRADDVPPATPDRFDDADTEDATTDRSANQPHDDPDLSRFIKSGYGSAAHMAPQAFAKSHPGATQLSTTEPEPRGQSHRRIRPESRDAPAHADTARAAESPELRNS